MSNKLEGYGKQLELAGAINAMKPFLLYIDLEFARKCVNDLREHGGFIDSAAVLNPMYNPLKPDIIRKQAKALSLLVEFIELLKEVDQMKERLSNEQANKEEIMKLFM